MSCCTLPMAPAGLARHRRWADRAPSAAAAALASCSRQCVAATAAAAAGTDGSSHGRARHRLTRRRACAVSLHHSANMPCVRIPIRADGGFDSCSNWRLRASSSSRRDRAPEHHETSSLPCAVVIFNCALPATLTQSIPANCTTPCQMAECALNVCMCVIPGCPCAATPQDPNKHSPCLHVCVQRRNHIGYAGSRNRTRDLLITNQLLYQLSYAGAGLRF